MQYRSFEGQFYNYDIVKNTVSHETEIQIDKIERTSNKGVIKQHLLKWKGYEEELNSWVDASGFNRI
jgi:hypothetical protein